MQGANEFYGENGQFVETLDVWWFINHYGMGAASSASRRKQLYL